MRRVTLIAAFTLTALLSGCATGKWSTLSVQPADKAAKFEVASLELKWDGTYSATANYKGTQQTSTGKWKLYGETLEFIPEKGPARTYNAEVADMGQRLIIKDLDDNATWTAVLKKQ